MFENIGPALGLGLVLITAAASLCLVFIFRDRAHRYAPPWLKICFVLMGAASPVGAIILASGHAWGIAFLVAGIPIYASGISTIVSYRMDDNAPVMHNLPARSRLEDRYFDRIQGHIVIWSMMTGSLVFALWMVHIMIDGIFSSTMLVYSVAAVFIGCFAPLAACYLHSDIASTTSDREKVI